MFTPGPWRVSNNELGCENYDILAEWQGLKNVGIATVVDGRFSDFRNDTVALHRDTLAANARLIAAAPQLLEALQELVDVSAEDTPRVLKAWDKARAAIAAATEENPLESSERSQE